MDFRGARVRSFFAVWTWHAVTGAGTIAPTGWIVSATWRGAAASISSFAVFVLTIAVGIACGIVLSAFLGGMTIVSLIFRVLARWNGAPFVVDDQVTLLTGPDRGVVARVYDIWPSRHQLRVDLGAERKRSFADVVSEHEVCRVS